MSAADRISIIIPILNEEPTIAPLVERCLAAMSELARTYEIILIDDGSSDESWRVVQLLASANPDVRGYRLRRNFGKAAALALGAEVAGGSIIITLDADLQDDPAEIPKLLSKLNDGFDLVSGWKEHRRDPPAKIAASRFFNLAVRCTTRLKFNDFNSGFKAARCEVYRRIPLYGELHRFIPVLADDLGYRIAEIPVTHHPRTHGQSKYGIERMVRGCLDLLTVLTITRFSHRPAHLFGGIGLVLGTLGIGILAYLAIHWFLFPDAIGTRPLFFLGILLSLLSAQFLFFGMLAELFLFRSRTSSLRTLIADTTTLRHRSSETTGVEV